jgi:sulfonate transport system substrate-binding protein
MNYRLPAGIGAALLLAGAAACSSASSPSASPASPGRPATATNTDVSNVTLNIGDQAGSGSQALLTAAGLISKLPFKAHWSDFTSGPPILQAMGSGSVDVGAVGDAPPVFEAASGGQVAVVAATASDPASVALLVPKGSPITSISQLKGKSIAVAQGSASHYHLLALLTKFGLTIKDVKPDYLQPAQAQAAFASGHVAAWDVWSPFIEQAEVQDGAKVLYSGSAVSPVYSFEVASRAALANPAKAAAIRDYLGLIEQADQWVAAHPSVWASAWGKATGLPAAVMTKAVADDPDNPAPITPTVLKSEQSVADAFASAGLIPGKVDFSKYAVTTFNSLLGGSS